MMRLCGSVAACTLAAGLALSLSGCNDGSDEPEVVVDDLAMGSYVVSTGSPDAPTTGRYYAGADGSRLLLLQSHDEQVSQLYRRTGTSPWTAVPPSAEDVHVSLLSSNTNLGASSAVDPAGLQGSYVAQVGNDATATFTITTDGRLVPGTSACRLSGTLGNGTPSLPGTLALSLNTNGCGSSLPASGSGVLIVDRNDAPAAFRLVVDDGAKLIDLLAFAE